ncbi:hypothetical protein [Noviherbaspirillum malthae]|jgi:hypothetical protein|uniref:hypothetical protein n=1 Tax=Noviherbaspirillum malthae TaxID=1260987 RepID=UPI00188E3648|nr:hypothetical protein [Noviherbaspirillum malthae]
MKRTITAMLLACCGLQACGLAGTEGRQTIAGGLQSEMRDIRLQMVREIGDASARRPEQCHVVPLGVRACGGPRDYLIYSSAISDERKLEELARQYAEAEEKYNRVTGAASTCTHVMPPQVRLDKGKCTGGER